MPTDPTASSATTTSLPSEQAVLDILAGFDRIFGLHPGFRPAHAKGAMCSGVFTPSPAAAKLTRAPHALRSSTPVLVRFSDSTGIPQIPDNDANASPRGLAIRFNLGAHIHTDLVAHSAEGFPTRTGEEFLELLTALATSAPDAPKPSPVEVFLGSHPKALQFVTMPKPFPTSFARESFFTVSAFQFSNEEGATRYGRFKIRPTAGNEYLSNDEAAKKSGDFLFEELTPRIGRAPIKFGIFVQIAQPDDETDDATAQWPTDREEIEFGTVTLTKLEDHNEPELRKVIFDPIPRVDGLGPSADPLFEVRAAVYLMSGRRRRAAGVSTPA